MKSENSQREIKDVKDLMRDIFRENKRREYHWETLADEVLVRIQPGFAWPKSIKISTQKTVESFFPSVRREMEEAKEGVFCPTFKDDKSWKIVAQTLKDLEEDAEDVILELLRRQRRAEAFKQAEVRGAEAAVEQGILDRAKIDKELASVDVADKRALDEKSEEEDGDTKTDGLKPERITQGNLDDA